LVPPREVWPPSTGISPPVMYEARAARRQFKRGDLNALDPSVPVHVPCLVVLPVTGPVGPVPNL
jgi:hypothetical protein